MLVYRIELMDGVERVWLRKKEEGQDPCYVKNKSVHLFLQLE